MKPSRMFWGTLFISVGVFFLLDEALDIGTRWGMLWRLWPLLLVLLGIGIMIKRQVVRSAVAGVVGVGAGLLVYQIASFTWIDALRESLDEDAETVGVQEFIEPVPAAVTKAAFATDAAGGTFRIDTTRTHLLEAKLKRTAGRYVLQRSTEDSVVHLHLTSEGSVVVKAWNRDEALTAGVVKLNPALVWDMAFDVGAAKMDLDLRPFTIERLSLDAGAASIRMYLGVPQQQLHCRVETGVSTVRISVPESVGCEIRWDGKLSSKRFDGFEKVSDRLYRTDNFATTPQRIVIVAKPGLSTFRVDRY